MITKSIKLALEYSKDNKISQKDFFKELRDIQYKTYLACNRAMTYLYTNDMQSMIQKDVGIPIEGDKVLYGKSFQAWIENRMNEIMDGCLSTNVAQTRSFVVNRYKSDKKSGLLKGNISLSQFKRTIPVFIHNKAYRVIETPKGLGLEIRFFNKSKKQELGVEKFLFLLPKLGGHEKSTLKRLFDGSYKLGAGQISYNKRKNKWMIAIAYSFEPTKTEAKENLVMGIDLGITKVVAMSIYDIDKEEYLPIGWSERTIDGAELITYRQKIEARRKATSISSKWASDNNVGRGFNARMENSKRIGDKYSRFRDTFNHKVSRYIINIAIKHKVGIIQMEDLSGFSEEQQYSLLKNWSYFDLQEKIIYKANENGIEVHLINPKFTSQRCSRCGAIDKDNRKSQSSFECLVCNYKDNADLNASKNICLPNIENIIEETLKVDLPT